MGKSLMTKYNIILFYKIQYLPYMCQLLSLEQNTLSNGDSCNSTTCRNCSWHPWEHCASILPKLKNFNRYSQVQQLERKSIFLGFLLLWSVKLSHKDKSTFFCLMCLHNSCLPKEFWSCNWKFGFLFINSTVPPCYNMAKTIKGYLLSDLLPFQV